ncbi:chloramphenicol-sensitive protein RarD [Spirochaetia bacterium]|nr:chloramphenicol-sensitive protein RarD [Spirochaetia bacterium]
MTGFKKGILYAVFAYALWGVLPLYWHLLKFTGPFHILGCRITFSLIFTALILFITGNRGWIGLVTRKGSRFYTICAGLVVSFNWGLYIWAVNSGHTIDASLGYYINPLVVVLLGLIFMKEKLNALQWGAFGLAVAGVILLAVFSGVFPWIALLLALSFGLYGLFKKKNPARPLESLSAETLAVLPLGLVLIFLPPRDLPLLASLSPAQWALLASAGAVTAIPLLAFARSARLLPLSTVGFLQFINPTILFFLGGFAFGESFPAHNLWAFGLIWAAVVLYCVSLKPRRVPS